ncbi:unnamed protein product [Rotaria socialis]|uniref:Uncharacterized protein n=1 Tax=Rotaria socialis TaxID=392032 RepID=A0A817S1Y1_9BILA|nr:unnamed protein product [Rotaria socialis]
METEQDVMVKKNNNMKRRRCRRRQRQQLERMVLELTEMRQDIQQLRATEESHNGSIKTLFLSLGDTDFVAEKLQVKTASTTSLASIWLRWQAYDEYYEDDYEEADDFRSDDQRYEDAETLEPFGITDLSQINFVSDRGSNLAKALKPYSPAYCVDYRLNNIIKKCFYQTGKIKYKADDYITNETNELVCSSDSEDDNDVIDIPSSAANILKTILSCKNLVKFVKQSGLNKIIQDQCGVAVLQATVVRWLSMSQLLESVNRSYRQIKKILGDRKKVIVLDKLIILQLIILLRTFKHIILFLQKGKEPTLHLVTIAIITLQYLLEYDQSYQENPSGEELQEDDEYLEENEGMRFFRIRLYQLLNIMFALEPIHLAATLLHP